MSPVPLIVLALAALCALAGLLWLLGRRLERYDIADVARAYAFAPLAVFYAWFGPGWYLRRFMLAALVVLWSVRLGSHLLKRTAARHPREDGRYTQRRQAWAANFAPRMLAFFQLQAVSVVLLGITFLPSMFNTAPRFHRLELIGVVLWFIALYGEAIADAQLAAFQRDPANRPRVCTSGLWRFSRHPNYFFEWLGWLAYFLFALASPWGWLALVGPAGILYLLLRVTGLPPTEAQALHTRGDAYRRYQQTTSPFLPWLPRRRTAAAPLPDR